MIVYNKIKEFFRCFYTPYSAFAFLFCLIPYRILGMLHVDIYIKFLVLILSFLLFFYILKEEKEIISYLLESVILQYFFFILLKFENLIWNMSPFQRYFFMLCFGFSLGAWPSQWNDPTFYYLLFLFLYAFYNRLKDIFLNPTVEAAIYSSLLSVNGESYNLKWKDITINISSISLLLFGRPVSNQLGEEISKRSFPHITKRYMFRKAAQAVKTNPELTTVAAGLGTVFGYGVSEINQNQRYQEAIKMAEMANNQALKANALREVELGIKTKEEYIKEWSILKCSYEETYTTKLFNFVGRFFL